jgi:hypothetical protein
VPEREIFSEFRAVRIGFYLISVRDFHSHFMAAWDEKINFMKIVTNIFKFEPNLNFQKPLFVTLSKIKSSSHHVTPEHDLPSLKLSTHEEDLTLKHNNENFAQ